METKARKSVGNPISQDWKILKYLTCNADDGSRGRGSRKMQRKVDRARDYLRETVTSFCEEHGFEPEEFSMTDLESMREKVDRIWHQPQRIWSRGWLPANIQPPNGALSAKRDSEYFLD